MENKDEYELYRFGEIINAEATVYDRRNHTVWEGRVIGHSKHDVFIEDETSVHSIPKKDIVKLEARISIKDMTLERLIKYLDAHAYDDLVVSGDPKGDVYKTTIFSGEVGVQENRQSMIDSVNCSEWGWER